MNEPSTLNLHDVVLPEPVSWTPQTPGWWIVLALAAAVLAWTAYAGLRRRRAGLYRRLALARLTEIEQALSDPERRAAAQTELPVLVKKTALACWPRSEVASLTGAPWLRFLDETSDGDGFSDGPGRLLPTLAYSTPETAAAAATDDLRALVDLVRRWIRRHRHGRRDHGRRDRVRV